MKLRLKGDTLRLRLTRPEVEAIGRGEAAQEITRFPDGGLLGYRFEPSAEEHELSVCWSDGLLIVRAALQAAVQWSSGSAVEIKGVIPLPHGGELRVLIEKDFECLHPGSSGATAGAFPNPASPAQIHGAPA